MTHHFDKLAPTDPGRVHEDWPAARERIHDDVLARAHRPRWSWAVGLPAAAAVAALAFGAVRLLPDGQVAVPAATPSVMSTLPPTLDPVPNATGATVTVPPTAPALAPGVLTPDGERVSEVLLGAQGAVPGVFATAELLADGRMGIAYLETHPRAQEFVDLVNTSAGESARAIVWEPTYYSQDMIPPLSQAVSAEMEEMGLEFHGGYFDEDAREFVAYTPMPPAGLKLSDRLMGNVVITVRLAGGASLPEGGTGG